MASEPAGRTTSASTTYDMQVRSARIILLAQALSVTGGVLGLIGLTVGYIALRRGGNRSGVSTRAPTIE